jgi:hypothetical protein
VEIGNEKSELAEKHRETEKLQKKKKSGER